MSVWRVTHTEDGWKVVTRVEQGVPGVGVPSGGTTGQVLAKASNTNYDTVWATGGGGGGGSGTVTSVAMTVPSILAVAGSPVTTAGTLALTLATQSANRVLAGPTTGSAAGPTFRALVVADIPALSYDASGAAAAAQAASQPLDSDLTAIAALTTTTFGRSLLTQADAAAARTTLGAGTGSGDVVGPATSTDTAIAVWNGTTGKLLKDSNLFAGDKLISSSSTPGWRLRVNGSGRGEISLFDSGGGGSFAYNESTSVFEFGPGITSSGTFSGNGSGLTTLNGSNVSSGTVAAARIDSAIARLASPTLTGTPLAPTAAAATNTTQIATTAFVQGEIATAVTGLLEFKGSTDCSSNPNYPAASKGDSYIVSVAGKIGGASGTSVDVGDWYLATADNAGGTEASVGTSWSKLEHNLIGALLAANNLSDLASASTARGNLGLGTLATQSGTFSGTHSGTSSGTNTGDQTSVSGNAGTATALATARAIYGNNFDGTAALTQIIASTFGGTGNGFAKLSGPTTSEKTFTLPDATCTILTSNAAVTIAQGGTNLTGYTAGDVVYCSATNVLAKLAIGAAGKVLTSSSSLPAWKDPAGDLATATDAATVTFDLATSRRQIVTLGGNRTLALSNDADGMAFTIVIKQDGTGSRVPTFWSGIKWPAGAAPTLTTTAGKYDVFAFLRIASGEYLGFAPSQNH